MSIATADKATSILEISILVLWLLRNSVGLRGQALIALSMFMRQVLESDGSCQKAVNGWAAQCAVAPADILTAALEIRAK